MELRCSDKISRLVATTLYSDVVLILRVVKSLEILIPLGVRIESVIGIGLLDGIGGHKARTHPEVLQLRTAHHILIELLVSESGNTVKGSNGNGRIRIIRAGFGRNDYDTIRTLRTIDGSS